MKKKEVWLLNAAFFLKVGYYFRPVFCLILNHAADSNQTDQKSNHFNDTRLFVNNKAPTRYQVGSRANTGAM